MVLKQRLNTMIKHQVNLNQKKTTSINFKTMEYMTKVHLDLKQWLDHVKETYREHED